MTPIRPDWPGAPGNIGAMCTTRQGGFSPAPYDDGSGGGGLNLGTHVGDDPTRVQQNRALLRQILPAEPAWLEQVHGTVVVNAAEVSAPVVADASFSGQPGVVCAVMTADCLPVLLTDRTGTVVAAAHAGWRGLAGGVLQRTVDAMRRESGQDILAWLGPAIGPARFEVGEDVRAAFGEIDGRTAQAFATAPGPGKYLADIYELARMLLNATGVESVAGGEFCTVSDKQRFYSYRRDGVTGRMASLIWIR